jgi:hypothetical protein
VKLKPFSKAYLQAAMEHDKRRKGTKSPLNLAQPSVQESSIHQASISNENSLSNIVNINTNRHNQERNATRNSLLKSKDLTKEIEEIKAENLVLGQYVEQVEKREAKREFRELVDRERRVHEKKMRAY